MKTNIISLTLLVAVMLLSGNCEINDETNKLLTKNFPLGNTVELIPNITYQSEEADLSVVFDSIVNDSRCPANVQCIKMGNAKTAIRINWNGQETNATLNTNPSNQQVIKKGNYNIRLIDVHPYPQAFDPIPQENYTIRMVVSE